MKLWFREACQDQDLYSETQQQSRATRRPRDSPILCKRDSNMAKRARDAFGPLFGFGRKTDSLRGQKMRHFMAKLREIFNKLPTVFYSISTKQHSDSDERRRLADSVPRRIPGVLVCSQATTLLLSHRYAQSFAHPHPNKSLRVMSPKTPSQVTTNRTILKWTLMAYASHGYKYL